MGRVTENGPVDVSERQLSIFNTMKFGICSHILSAGIGARYVQFEFTFLRNHSSCDRVIHVIQITDA